MASFEEDLEYANKILRVRTMMEDKTLLAHPDFLVKTVQGDVLEFLMKDDSEVYNVIGYMYNRAEPDAINWFGVISLNVNYLNHTINVIRSASSYPIYDYDLSEEWHFQQSLVVDPVALRGMVVIKLLHSVPSNKDYFKFRLRHLDEIIRKVGL